MIANEKEVEGELNEVELRDLLRNDRRDVEEPHTLLPLYKTASNTMSMPKLYIIIAISVLIRGSMFLFLRWGAEVVPPVRSPSLSNPQ